MTAEDGDRRLTEVEVVRLVRRALAGREVESVVELGAGADHLAFEVNGTFVARIRRRCDRHTAAAIVREIELLDILSRVSPIPVPDVAGADPEGGLIVLRRLSGT